MDLLRALYTASVELGGYEIHLLEVVGVVFGVASAVGGMRRQVWAWPVGIVGNVLLLGVYVAVTAEAAADGRAPLLGQSGRQLFFLLVGVYGWWRWARLRGGRGEGAPALTPRWARRGERLTLLAAWLLGTAGVQAVLAAVGAAWPAPRWFFWCDAWIFVGSLLATYAMARGWTEFWLIWIGVDVVGVPLLLHGGYLPSAVMYAAYAVFVLYGLGVWLRAARDNPPSPPAGPARGRPDGGLPAAT